MNTQFNIAIQMLDVKSRKCSALPGIVFNYSE